MTDFRRGKNCKAQFKKAVICQKEGDVRLAVVSISKLRSGVYCLEWKHAIECGKFGKGRIMIRNATRNQKLGWVMFGAYLASLVYFMFFAESFGRAPAQREYAYNLELFREIRRFYQYRHQLGMEAFLLNVVGNVIAFLPCGFFLPVILKNGRKWYSMCLLSFGISLCIETIQLICKVGSFDVDDLLLNTTGGALGYLCFYLVQTARIRRKRREKTEV